MLTVAILAAISLPLAVLAAVHWDYHSHGGAAGWGALHDEETSALAFPDCSLLAQSPIDIKGFTPESGSGIQQAYVPTAMSVFNNGHTLQVNYAAGSKATLEGKEYDLLQFHFHSPSEHELNSELTPLEGHFVHRAADGEYAVVGVMMVVGAKNTFFQQVLDNAPEEEGEGAAAGTISASSFMPASLAYYNYDGSFTTPPCTEGVNWFVLDAPIEVSQDQVDEFRGLEFMSHEGEFFGNNRPVQALNGRQVGAQATATATPTATASPTATATATATTPAATATATPTTPVAPRPPATGTGNADQGSSSPFATPLPIALALVALLGGAGVAARQATNRRGK